MPVLLTYAFIYFMVQGSNPRFHAYYETLGQLTTLLGHIRSTLYLTDVSLTISVLYVEKFILAILL